MKSFELLLHNCCHEVWSELQGFDHNETVWQNALQIELENEGVDTDTEYHVNLTYKGKKVGFGRIDILCEYRGEEYILELKMLEGSIRNKYENQCKKYLRETSIDTGFVINFNDKKFEIVKVNL